MPLLVSQTIDKMSGGCLKVAFLFPFLAVASAMIGEATSPRFGGLVLALVVIALTCALAVKSYRKAYRDWGANVQSENPYAILGVLQTASAGEIRNAYRKLMQLHHPDAVDAADRGQAAEIISRVNQAYELLSNSDDRWHYDGLIEEQKGQIPPLELALQLVRRLAFHPTTKWFDDLQNWEQHHPNPTHGDESNSESQTPLTDAEPGAATPPVEPVDLEVPEAVREMLDMNPNNSPESRPKDRPS